MFSLLNSIINKLLLAYNITCLASWLGWVGFPGLLLLGRVGSRVSFAALKSIAVVNDSSLFVFVRDCTCKSNEENRSMIVNNAKDFVCGSKMPTAHGTPPFSILLQRFIIVFSFVGHLIHFGEMGN